MGTKQERVEKTAEKTTETKNDSIRQEYTFAPDVKLKECKYCRVMIPKKAKMCPNCKMVLKNYTFLKVIASILVLAVIVVESYCLSAYCGLLPDSVVPAWIAQNGAETPTASETAAATTGEATEEIPETVSTESVETTETAASAELADLEVTEKWATIENEEDVGETAEEGRALDSADTLEGVETIAWNDNTKDKETLENNISVEDNNGKDTTGDKSDSAGKDADNDKSDLADKDTDENNSGSADKDIDETEEPEETKSNTDAKTSLAADPDSKDTELTMAKDNDDTENNENDDSAPNSFTTLVSKELSEDEAAFRADCEQRKYKNLLRDEKYLDTAVLVTELEVVCPIDGGLFDESIYYLCKGKENDIECYYIIRDDRDGDETLILEGDIITVYGQLFGTCKIPANLIETKPTVPAVSMVSFDLLDE
ncbi:MAG: MSCRAMM family adhesin SdrC [Eubacterium sp.]|nr:MSCRAMM family adhesin SdrC [Eubacterium sp.]